MKKKSQPSDLEKLEAPVQLTPAQLETVAAGVARQIAQVNGGIGSTATNGFYPKEPVTDAFLRFVNWPIEETGWRSARGASDVVSEASIPNQR